MSRDMGLIGGVALASAAWAGVIGCYVQRGHAVPWVSVQYNVPITLVFAGLCAHIACCGVRLGPRRFLGAYAPVGLMWAAGAILLYLRLVSRSVDVSGHMAWSVMMGVQSLLQRLPTWFILSAWAVVAQVAVLKFLVYGGHSGHKGLVVGAGLALGVWLAIRRHPDLECRDL